MVERPRRFVLTPSAGALDRDGYYRVSDYELATGWVGGFHPVPKRAERSAASPRAAFEAALLPALLRAPCVVAFSGGRDSSAVLAVATHVARREGLPDPIPATYDFSGGATPAHRRAGETGFQELVVEHLGLREWYRFTDVAVCDVLAAPARRGLRRHGLLWPAMLHTFEPMLELTAGSGSVVVGEGGDEMLGKQRMSAISSVLTARPLARRRAIRTLAAAATPSFERRRRARHAFAAQGMLLPYLRADVAADLVAGAASDVAQAPLRWDRAVLRQASGRAATAAAVNFRKVCATAGATFHAPFMDPGFVECFAAAGGWRGWPDRAAMMRMLFDDVVPEPICLRTTKAEFGAVASGEASREFLESWTGAGVDPAIVDPEILREVATTPRPPFAVQLLIQAAWLATQHEHEHEPRLERS